MPNRIDRTPPRPILDEANLYLLLITLLVTIVNFSSERTKVMHGVVHLTLFATYVVLIFD